MTYLSQFPKAKLKPGAPLKPKLNPKKARAYGRGKEGGGRVGFEACPAVLEVVMWLRRRGLRIKNVQV